MRIIAAWTPDELGNTCDRARPHCHTVCFLRQTRSAKPHKRTETLPPSSCTNDEDASDATRLSWASLFSELCLASLEMLQSHLAGSISTPEFAFCSDKKEKLKKKKMREL